MKIEIFSNPLERDRVQLVKATSETPTEASVLLEKLLPKNEEPTSHTALVQLVEAATKGKKILAIKAVRELTGCGLKEAKELVDRGWASIKEHNCYNLAYQDGYNVGRHDGYSAGYDAGKGDGINQAAE